MHARETKAQVLRPAKTIAVALFVFGSVLAAVGGWQMRKSEGLSVAHAIMLFGALNIAGAIQHLLARIVLLSDRIEFGGPFGRTSIAKTEIESVTWEAGCGVSLRMKSQSWRRIPDLGRAQGVCNSIRAWLKR